MKIALVGYMGTGKSSVGQRLARQLDLPFWDTDHLLEQSQGRSITSIFEQGEALFRQCECDLWPTLEHLPDGVLATGGGFPCHDGLMDKLLAHFTVVYLHADPNLILSRLGKGLDKRPLLAAVSPNDRCAFIEHHLALRRPFYEKAPIIMEAKSLRLSDLLLRLS